MPATNPDQDELDFIANNSSIILADDGSPMIAFSYLGEPLGTFHVRETFPDDAQIRRALNFAAWERQFEDIAQWRTR